MKTKPYNKHQLYKGNYSMSDGGEVQVPDKCYWIVRKYLGTRHFGQEDDTGPITLILNEDYNDGKGFWSVISFLTLDEATELGKKLIEMGKVSRF